MSKTAETVLAIVRYGFQGDDQIVRPESSFEDIGIDSLDLLDIIIRVEKELGVDLGDVPFSELETIGQLIEHAERAQK